MPQCPCRVEAVHEADEFAAHRAHGERVVVGRVHGLADVGDHHAGDRETDLAALDHAHVDVRRRAGRLLSACASAKPGKPVRDVERSRVSRGVHEADRRALVEDVRGDDTGIRSGCRSRRSCGLFTASVVSAEPQTPPARLPDERA
jgi:hypothetical protein